MSIPFDNGTNLFPFPIVFCFLSLEVSPDISHILSLSFFLDTKSISLRSEMNFSSQRNVFRYPAKSFTCRRVLSTGDHL